MAASVLFACGLNDQKLPSFVHISEESNVDGSFLISSILGQRLRISNAGTVLVCLQHNYQHYFHAGMRLGYNANIFNGKTLHVVDPLTEMARNGITCKWLRDERRLTVTLLDAIRDHINTSVAQRNSTTVLIDNLAILLNLGATKEDIILLCHDLAELPKQYENLTVITKMSNCDLYEPLDNNVAKLGTLRIRAAQLKSGVSRDVDGKLLIEREVIGSGEQEKLKQKYELKVQGEIQIEKEKEQEQAYEQKKNHLVEKFDVSQEKEAEYELKKEQLSEKMEEDHMGESEQRPEHEQEKVSENKKTPKNEEPEKKTEHKNEQKQEEVFERKKTPQKEEPQKKMENKEEQIQEEVSEKKQTPQKEKPEKRKEQKEEQIQELVPEKGGQQQKWRNQELQQEEMDTQENNGYVLELVRKEVLYKVNDRSIKILSPGEVGVRV